MQQGIGKRNHTVLFHENLSKSTIDILMTLLLFFLCLDQGRSNDEDEEELMSSTESSDSEPPSDNDSDFGPRGPRRGGIRARGGRKGLTTRGGSTVATRRRGSNKQMDMEQVRRLDMEMAAAVSAMKSPEKDEKLGKEIVKQIVIIYFMIVIYMKWR